MVRFDALVTAGGKGTRMDATLEKPLMEVGGRPMVDRVLNALNACGMIDEVVASVSDNAPNTRTYLEGSGIRLVETEGDGYVPDLRTALRALRSERVLVVPADLPLLSGPDLEWFLNGYMRKPKETVMVAASLHTVTTLGATPSYVFEMEGENMVYTGVSVVHRQGILDGRYLEEGWLITTSPGFAVNVNSVDDLVVAERILSQSTRASNDS